VAATGADKLTAAQKRQITVINESRSSWSQLGNTTIGVFGNLAVAGVNAFTSIEVATSNAAASMSRLVVQEGASLVRWAIGGSVAVYGLGKAFASHGSDVDGGRKTLSMYNDEQTRLLGINGRVVDALAVTGAAVATSSAGYIVLGKGAEFAAIQALKYATGAGAAITIASVGYKSLEYVLARTGKETIELADGTQKVITNLDRVNDAAKDVGRAMAEGFHSVIDTSREAINSLGKWPDLWHYVDDAAKLATDNIVFGLKATKKAYDEVSIAAVAAAKTLRDGQTYEAYRKETIALRELSELHEKLDEMREKEAASFGRLKQANQE
jgi:hypothetical protein